MIRARMNGEDEKNTYRLTLPSFVAPVPKGMVTAPRVPQTPAETAEDAAQVVPWTPG